MDYELEVARDNALASPDAALVQEGNNLPDIPRQVL